MKRAAALDDIRKSQRDVCAKFGAPFVECHATLKIGLSRGFNIREYPINGLRHPLEVGTTGWFIWSGAWSDSADFFEPHHLYHLHSQNHPITKFLGLAPGWRFFLAPDHEDVWEDLKLLDI